VVLGLRRGKTQVDARSKYHVTVPLYCPAG
jgi:hypothetical protein